MPDGKTKSVYVMADVDGSIKRHAERNVDRSYSWALNDLVRRGAKVAGIRESLKLLQEEEGG